MYLQPPTVCVCIGMATDRLLLCWLLQLLQTGILGAISLSSATAKPITAMLFIRTIHCHHHRAYCHAGSTFFYRHTIYVKYYSLFRNFHHAVFKNVNEYNTCTGDGLFYILRPRWGENSQLGLIDAATLNVSDYQSGPAEYVSPQLLACECSYRLLPKHCVQILHF